MILSASKISIFALLFSIIQSAQIRRIIMNNLPVLVGGGGLGIPAPGGPTETEFCDNDDLYTVGPFTDDTWNTHTWKIFSCLDHNRAKILLTWLAQRPNGANYFGNNFDQDWDIDRVKKMASNITKGDLQVMPPAACPDFARIFKYIEPSLMVDMRADCVYRIYKHLPLRTPHINDTGLVELTNKMTPEFLERYAHQILDGINTKGQAGTTFLSSLKKPTLQILFKDERLCRKISTQSYLNLIRNKEKALIFKPACFTSMIDSYPQTGLAKIGSDVTNLPADAFQLVSNPLHDDYFTYMTKEQAQNYDALIASSYDKCQHLKLEKFRHNIEGLTGACIAEHLWLRKSALGELGPLWNKIDDSIFEISEVHTWKTMISKINVKDFTHMKLTLLDKVLSNVEGCPHVPVQAITNKKMKISGKCFKELNYEAQSKVLLIIENPEEDLLDYVRADSVNLWHVHHKNEYYYKSNVLMLLEGKPNAAKIISRFGSKTEGKHPCATIDEYQSFKKNKILQKNMSSECFQEMSLEITDKQWLELDPRLAGLQSYERIINKVSDWEKMEAKDISAMVKGGQFCKSVTGDIVQKINNSALATFTPTCVAQLRDKNQLGVEQIKALPDDAFTLFNLKMTEELVSLDNLTDKQFGQLGMGIKNKTDSGAAAITEAHLNAASSKKIAEIKVWPMIPSASYKGITVAEKLDAINPEYMTEMTLDQVKNIPVLKHMKPAQILKVGSLVKPAENPIQAFTDDILKEMPAEAKEAVEKRKKDLEKAKVGSSATNTLLNSTFSIILIVVTFVMMF